MLQNTKVTAFTISELLRENQQGAGGEGLKLPLTRLGLKPLTIFAKRSVVNVRLDSNTLLAGNSQ